MNILADENVSFIIVEHLRLAGHHVRYIFEIARGSVDVDILDDANQQTEILLTNDKDFGQLVFQEQQQSSGVILMRLHGMPMVERAEMVVNLLHEYGPALLKTFTVLTVNKRRVLRVISKQSGPEEGE